MSRVFVSYSRQDAGYARALARALRAEGLEIWTDGQIASGQNWEREIQRVIDNCGAVIVVMSPNSEKSEWVNAEIHYAKRRGKPILPLLLSGEAFFGLGGLHYVDVTDGRLPGRDFIARIHALVEQGSPTASATDTGQANEVGFLSMPRSMRKLLPLYVVFERSTALSDETIYTFNSSIISLFLEIGSDPILARRTRFGLIAFASEPEIVLPLCDLSVVTSLPVLRPATVAVGAAQYGPTFSALRVLIEADLASLKREGDIALRPVVFFLTGSRPVDSRWREDYAQLVEDGWPLRPNILAFGYGEADPAMVMEIATVRAFMAVGANMPAEAFREFARTLVNSVTKSVSSSRHGVKLVMPDQVQGFSSTTSFSSDVV